MNVFLCMLVHICSHIQKVIDLNLLQKVTSLNRLAYFPK